MIDSVFGGLFSLLTLIFVLGLVVMMIVAIRKRNHITKWGRLIGLFILAGTAISAFAAMRDAYGTADALFSMTSMQSNICSITGGAIFLTGLVSIFLKKQTARRACFFLISALFSLQVLTIEVSRLVMVL